jgi:hypothetical protein
MSQRQRRRQQQRRRQTERRGSGKRKVAAGATIAMGATLAASGSAQAATFTVSNLNDDGTGSLRQAIKDANTNGIGSDDIVFASGLSGTIDVGSSDNGGLYALTAMNIKGPGADKLTLRGGGANLDYVFYSGSDGGVYGGSAGDPVTLSGVTITGGNAAGHRAAGYTSGGGIWNQDFNLTVAASVIAGNYAQNDGGGIWSATPQGSLTVVDSAVSGNSASSDASSYGGGIMSDSPVTIQRSTVSGNTTGGDGGGIYVQGDGPSPLTIENSTIADNSSVANGSDDEGGGTWNYDGPTVIRSSTITGNRVGGTGGLGGGIYTGAGNAAVITNSILANNHGTTGNDLYLRGDGQVGFSLIKDTANATQTGHSLNQTGPNVFGVDPQLGGLASNGGPTQTETPAASSPVIDKGNASGLTSDQRGVLRPIDFPAIPNVGGGDGSDIGAVELQPSNALKLGKLKRNKKKGTAKQIVFLPLPDAGTVTIKGKGLKTKTRNVTGGKKVKLPVIAKGKKRKALNQMGKAKIKAKVTYHPTGNAVKTLKRKLKLLKQP